MTLPSGGGAPQALTSDNNPIRVAWIDPVDVPAAAGWTGRVGMTFLPGKRDLGVAGLHQRDLRADVERLRGEHQATTFLLLVEDHELAATSTTAITQVMAENGTELLRFPIVDGGVPSDGPFRALLDDVEGRLRNGQNVVVACRGGLGRTGTTVACLLREAGLSADEAIAVTRRRRDGAIETAAQEAFVRGWMPKQSL